jgi:hypothetical protein
MAGTNPSAIVGRVPSHGVPDSSRRRRVSLHVLRVWVLHVATKPKMGVLWISKVPFYWQIEKSVGRNGRKSCNEKVSKNTLFVAGFLSISNS